MVVLRFAPWDFASYYHGSQKIRLWIGTKICSFYDLLILENHSKKNLDELFEQFRKDFAEVKTFIPSELAQKFTENKIHRMHSKICCVWRSGISQKRWMMSV